MAIRKSSNSGIPFGNTAGRPANATLGQLYSNGEVGRLELYTSTGWQNIVQETPGVASISGTYNESAGSGTIIISGTNFVAGGIVYAVGTNGVEYQATTSTTNSIVQMTALFTGLSPAYEPYDIKVLNPSNLFGLLPDVFYINDNPVWTTSAGSLGSYLTGASVSIQLSSTDPESQSRTYSIGSGSLPAGLSLSSSGLISGTVSGDTTQVFNFAVLVSDGGNSISRSFSISYNAIPVITGGTLTSDSTYYYRTFTGTGNLIVSNISATADILMIAGGGAGGTNGPGAGAGSGGGAGGVISTNSAVTIPVATHTITIGGGAAGIGDTVAASSGQAEAGNGTNSSATINSIAYVAYGGGGGGSAGQYGRSGGSGGGGNAGPTGASTQTSGTGYTGYGNAGFAGNGAPSGGGGGAGAAAVNNVGGSGLNTWSSWAPISALGQNGYIAGGGTGYASSGTFTGGAGGGGAFNTTSNQNGFAGVDNTGSGGGGMITSGGTAYRSGQGGSGIAIIRYTKASVGG